MEWSGGIDGLVVGWLKSHGVTRPDTLERLRVTLLSFGLWGGLGLAGALGWVLAWRGRRGRPDSASVRDACVHAALVLGLAGLLENGRLGGATGVVYGWDGPFYLLLLGMRVASLWLGLVGIGALLGPGASVLESAWLGVAVLALTGVFHFNTWQLPVGESLWVLLAWAGRGLTVLGAVRVFRQARAWPPVTGQARPAILAAIGWLAVLVVYVPLAGNAAPPDADMATLGTMARWILDGNTATTVVGPAGQLLQVRYPASGGFSAAFASATLGMAVHEAALAWWALAPALVFPVVLRILGAAAPRVPLVARLVGALAVTLFAVLHDTHLLGAYPRLLAWGLGALAFVRLIALGTPWTLLHSAMYLMGGVALQSVIALGFVPPLAVVVARQLRASPLGRLAAPVGVTVAVGLAVFAPFLAARAAGAGTNTLLIGPVFAWENLQESWPWLGVGALAALLTGMRARSSAFGRGVPSGRVVLALGAWLAGALGVTFFSSSASGNLGIGAAAGTVLASVLLAVDGQRRRAVAGGLTVLAVVLIGAYLATSVLGVTAGFSLLSLRDARFLAEHAHLIPREARLLAVEPPGDPDWKAFGIPIHQWWVPSFAAMRAVDWRVNEHHLVRGSAGPLPGQWRCHLALFDHAAPGCDWSQIDAVFVSSRNRGMPGARVPPSFALAASDGDGLQLFLRPALSAGSVRARP